MSVSAALLYLLFSLSWPTPIPASPAELRGMQEIPDAKGRVDFLVGIVCETMELRADDTEFSTAAEFLTVLNDLERVTRARWKGCRRFLRQDLGPVWARLAPSVDEIHRELLRAIRLRRLTLRPAAQLPSDLQEAFRERRRMALSRMNDAFSRFILAAIGLDP